MRKFFRWTVVFRGNIRRNGINMINVLVTMVKIIATLILKIVRFQIRVVCFVLGIDWLRLERSIQRKLRIYLS